MTNDRPRTDAAGTPRFWAFLSYSHRDAAIAARLQRALETYRVPRWLEGNTTPAGEAAPAFLKPIFRDRDDLQASPDLKARVQAALAQSRYLIVICSPDAARSEWVNEEIREFKRVHGHQRILALIAEGEPFASERTGHVDEECFPEALRFDDLDGGAVRRRSDAEPGHAEAPAARRRAAEPIAADLRPQGDGERLATLKIIAGMLGVGVDSLVRRDAQRRNRRMARVAAASLVGVVVMAGLTFMALRARTEAQEQRAQAESLVEFMLTDLRKKLEPVGRLDILDSLGSKALAYYASQQPSSLDATSLSRRSRALHLIGDMREQRGQLDDALAAFQSAAETTKVLLDRTPNDGARIYDHAQSVFWVGSVAYDRGRLAVAEEAWEQYDALANRLTAINVDKPEWKIEPAWSALALGTVQLDRGQFQDAQQSFRKALTITREMAASDPSLAYYESLQMGWLADAQIAAGDYVSAVDTERERLAFLATGAGGDTDRLMEQQAAHANDALARVELARGNASAAEPPAREAARVAWTLVKLDPSNVKWTSDVCFYEMTLAEVEIALGHLSEAHAELANVSSAVTRLVEGNAGAANSRVNLHGRALTVGARLAMLEGTAFAPEELRRYVADIAQMEQSGVELSATQRVIVAGAQLALGDEYALRNQDALARDSWTSAVARLQALGPTLSYPALATLACAETHLGHTDKARLLFDKLAASPYRRATCSESRNSIDHVGTRPLYSYKGERP